MKKFLFCAGVLALAASCTEDLDTISVQQQSKGITFVATDGNDAATRGHFEETEEGGSFYYEPFWWAEQDQIAILSTYTTGTTGGNSLADWQNSQAAAKYKATKSERLGEFTSVDANNLLNFSDATKKSQFLAIYPAGTTITVTAATTDPVSAPATVKVTGLPTLTAQTQKNIEGNGIYENMVKYSYSVAQKENEYDAVGEKVNLDFQRVLSGLVFRTLNADKYTKAAGSTPSTFGNLLTIEAKLTGNGDETNSTANTPALVYNNTDAALTLTMPAEAGGEVEAELANGTITSGAPATIQATYQTSTLTLKDASGLGWSDAARAYMVTLPLKMANLTKAENLQVTYKFENITFTKTYALEKKDWEAGKFYRVPALDINDYDYLLTDETSGSSNDRTLIVNKGNFSSIFDGESIKWAEGKVAKSTVGTIIVASDVTMTDADVAALNKFTNLKSVELNGVKSIPANAFNGLTGLTTIILPDVTEIDEDFINSNLTALATLNLASYNFANETVNGYLFNTSTKTSLKTLDISGVESMTPVFGIERTLSFQGYALTNVTVKDGVKLSPNAFSGCTSLATVNGVVDLTNGTSAFDGDAALAKININGTVIPAFAFNGCTKLTQVLYNGKQVVPTVVRESAFANVASVAVDASSRQIPFYMDLSQAKTIEDGAFKDSELTSDNANSSILTVGATAVNKDAFNGIPAKMIKFTDATTIYNDALANTSSLLQVKFVKPFTYGGGATAISATTFGTSIENRLILFVCSEQTGWTGTTLTLTGTATAGSSNTQDFKFKSITIED